MVFLPEACDFIEFTSKATNEKSEFLHGEFINNYRKLASDLKVWLSIGSFHRRVEQNGVLAHFNTHVIIDDSGEIKCASDKIHLFEINLKSGDSVMNLKESEYTTPGDEFYMPVESPIGLIAPSIVGEFLFTICALNFGINNWLNICFSVLRSQISATELDFTKIWRSSPGISERFHGTYR